MGRCGAVEAFELAQPRIYRAPARVWPDPFEPAAGTRRLPVVVASLRYAVPRDARAIHCIHDLRPDWRAKAPVWVLRGVGHGAPDADQVRGDLDRAIGVDILPRVEPPEHSVKPPGEAVYGLWTVEDCLIPRRVVSATGGEEVLGKVQLECSARWQLFPVRGIEALFG